MRDYDTFGSQQPHSQREQVSQQGHPSPQFQHGQSAQQAQPPQQFQHGQSTQQAQPPQQFYQGQPTQQRRPTQQAQPTQQFQPTPQAQQQPIGDQTGQHGPSQQPFEQGIQSPNQHQAQSAPAQSFDPGSQFTSQPVSQQGTHHVAHRDLRSIPQHGSQAGQQGPETAQQRTFPRSGGQFAGSSMSHPSRPGVQGQSSQPVPSQQSAGTMIQQGTPQGGQSPHTGLQQTPWQGYQSGIGGSMPSGQSGSGLTPSYGQTQQPAPPQSGAGQGTLHQTGQSAFGGSATSPQLDGPQSSTGAVVDMFDSPEELTILADLPGCAAEDVQVRTSNNTLYITAERSADVDGDSQPLMHERADRIERSIPLPADIDVEDADASCEEGVCRITLPKKEEAKQREIGIH